MVAALYLPLPSQHRFLEVTKRIFTTPPLSLNIHEIIQYFPYPTRHTMAKSYTAEELLKLRESPLVCKPASLPPVEEWMGYVQVVIIGKSPRLTLIQGQFPTKTRPRIRTREGPPIKGRAKRPSPMMLRPHGGHYSKRGLNQQMVC